MPSAPRQSAPAGVRDAVARGAAAGLSSVRAASAPPWAVAVGAAALGPLSEFPRCAVPCSDDMLASVVMRAGSAPAATAILALEPEAALELVRDALGRGPWPPDAALEAVRAAGEAVLRGALEALLGAAAAFGRARLEEDALTATLLRTHAPPEAALLSVEVLVAGERTRLRAVLLVLADAKGLAALAPA